MWVPEGQGIVVVTRRVGLVVYRGGRGRGRRRRRGLRVAFSWRRVVMRRRMGRGVVRMVRRRWWWRWWRWWIMMVGQSVRARAHVAAGVARRGRGLILRHLPLERDDLLLQPANAQLVLVLHAAEALLERAHVVPDVVRVLAPRGAERVADAAAGAAAVAGEAAGLGARAGARGRELAVLEHAGAVGRERRLKSGPALGLPGWDGRQDRRVWRGLLPDRLELSRVLRRGTSSAAPAEVLLLKLRGEAGRSVPRAHRGIDAQPMLVRWLTGRERFG